MRAADRPVLAPDLAGAVAQAGVDPTLDGRTLEEGLAWCLVWLMFPELGIGPFVV